MGIAKERADSLYVEFRVVDDGLTLRLAVPMKAASEAVEVSRAQVRVDEAAGGRYQNEPAQGA